jgi:hypothetical protein
MASGGRERPERTDRERSEHAAAAASFVRLCAVPVADQIDAVCPLCAHSLLSVSHGKTTAATTAKPLAKQTIYASWGRDVQKPTGRSAAGRTWRRRGLAEAQICVCAGDLLRCVVRLWTGFVPHYIEPETWSSFLRPSFSCFPDPTTYGARVWRPSSLDRAAPSRRYLVIITLLTLGHGE